MPTPHVLVCSDVHFGSHRQQLADEFVEALDTLPRARACVVISGDLVQSGSERDFKAASRFLASIRTRRVPLVLTPGNHDFGGFVHENGPVKVHEQPRKRFKRLWSDHLHQPCVLASHDMNAIYQVHGHVFVSLRSVHRGRIWGRSERISSGQIDWAQTTLKKFRLASAPLHLVTHRGLWDDRGGAKRAHRPMYRRRRLERELLERYSFQTIIHGHDHRCAWTAGRPMPKRSRPLDHLAVPSMSGTRAGEHGWVAWRPGSTPQFVRYTRTRP